MRLSLNKLAKLTGLTPSFILRLEQGHYQSLRLDVIEKIANGLNMDLEMFLRKCDILPVKQFDMPKLEFYLKEAFQYPPSAVEEIKQFMEFIEHKHSDEISRMREMHVEYWGKEKERVVSVHDGVIAM